MRRIGGNSKASLAGAVLAMAVIFSGSARAQQAPEVVAEPKRVIIVSIPDRKLALLQDGQVVKIYDIAVGRDESPTPTGTFTIANRLKDPTYYHDGKVVAPGPKNPVGNRWIGLSEKHYAIHGTNAPKSIGSAASHGCVRMAKKDVEELFNLVRVGDTVEIHGERDQQVAQIFSTPVRDARPGAPAGSQPVITAEVVPASVGGGSR